MLKVSSETFLRFGETLETEMEKLHLKDGDICAYHALPLGRILPFNTSSLSSLLSPKHVF